jgi:hypothetical protein
VDVWRSIQTCEGKAGKKLQDAPVDKAIMEALKLP